MKHILPFDLEFAVYSLKPLPTGITNQNFLVNDQFVLKVRQLGLDPFFSYAQENIIADIFYQHDLSPKYLTYNEQFNYSLSQFLSSSHKGHGPLYANREIIRIAQLITTYQSFDNSSLVPFNLEERYIFYRSKCSKKVFSPAYEEKIVREYNRFVDKSHLVLSHNDLVKNNFLFKGDKLYIIDFEFAGLNDSMFDDASFITENHLSPTQEKLFLQTRYPDGFDHHKLDIFKNALNLLWCYWGYYMYQKTNRALFLLIADEKKSLLMETFNH
ncbi:MAG TPA: phosphotransferase [Bacilli bacterium]|nr:phosphotransferase [Bacilli bacterium]